MSYDFDDGVPATLQRPRGVRGWLTHKWWRFVLWCALDANSRWINHWGLRQLGPIKQIRP